jgi:tRNA modification GTPase
MISLDDTICALASAPGIGGIAVIRISGPRAFDFADKVLQHRRGCAKYDGYTLHQASVIDGLEIVDDVIVGIFHAPKSYSGEHVVEISCHGGAIPTSRILALLERSGCRRAGPGEFTQRAFLNGKIDLSQAEAICDLINAKTDDAYRQAQQQRYGALSTAVETIRASLLNILAQIEASIDFPEDVGELNVAECVNDLKFAGGELRKLLGTASRGILLREGAQVVLVGRPNVGKSSLMNTLLRHDRAIVTSQPGTTRDTLEESVNIQGIAVRLWDTAGLRVTDDVVESIGVERTRMAIETADLVVLVVDSTTGILDEDRALLEDVPESRLLMVWNKCDLRSAGDLRISAKLGTGIEELEQAIVNRLITENGEGEASQAVISHVYQRSAVERALESVRHALDSAENDLSPDFLSIDVRGALASLGDLTGETIKEDVLTEIFSKFCIGK